MVNKNFIHNPQYYLQSHRTYSEATRDCEYACAIYAYAPEHGNPMSVLLAIVAVVGFGVLAYYFDAVIEVLR